MIFSVIAAIVMIYFVSNPKMRTLGSGQGNKVDEKEKQENNVEMVKVEVKENNADNSASPTVDIKPEETAASNENISPAADSNPVEVVVDVADVSPAAQPVISQGVPTNSQQL
jgi:hypothetical protein